MPAYFFESSAFVKRFAPERGSKFVLGLLRPSARNRFYAARITEVEVCAALIRRQRGKTLSADQVANARPIITLSPRAAHPSSLTRT
jgi:hypothetical protein